jgi:hypothetical protein
MLGIEYLLDKRKWKTQKVARCKMAEGKGLLGRSRCS